MHYPQAKRSALLVLVTMIVALGGCGPASPPAADAPTPRPAHGPAVSEGMQAVNGTQLYYKTIGEGPPIFFVHGGGGSHRYFLPELEPLADEHQLVFYDQRGRGLSDGEIDLRAITIEQFVEDIEALRASLGLERISLVGHSWGGVFAMFYAFKYQERVDRLILVDLPPMNGGFAADLAKTRSERLQKLSPDEQRTLTTVCEGPGSELSPETLAECSRLSATLDFYDPAKGLEVNPPDEDTARKGATILPLIRNSFNRLQKGMDAQLKALRVPTLVMYGDFDPIPAASSEYVQQRIPGAQLAVVQKSGHFPFIEQPETFIATVRAFLQEGRE